MELIFNELSTYHKSSNIYAANSTMEQLLKTCKAAKEYGFTKMRVSYDFEQLFLTNDYRILEWLNNRKVSPIYKSLLLGIKRYPYIEDGDEAIENQFISNYYYFNENDNSELYRKDVEGLAVAFLLNTLSISLPSFEVWKKTKIELLEKIEEKENIVYVKHISTAQHIEVHKEWINENRPLTLIETDIQPSEKKINLRDDHGKNVLKHIALKLNMSPYVVETINSLPYNPNERNFIKMCYPDGKIEIVLTWVDEGFGIIIQTTGQNLQETNAIANILKEKYGNK